MPSRERQLARERRRPARPGRARRSRRRRRARAGTRGGAACCSRAAPAPARRRPARVAPRSSSTPSSLHAARAHRGARAARQEDRIARDRPGQRQLAPRPSATPPRPRRRPARRGTRGPPPVRCSDHATGSSAGAGPAVSASSATRARKRPPSTSSGRARLAPRPSSRRSSSSFGAAPRTSPVSSSASPARSWSRIVAHVERTCSRSSPVGAGVNHTARSPCGVSSIARSGRAPSSGKRASRRCTRPTRVVTYSSHVPAGAAAGAGSSLAVKPAQLTSHRRAPVRPGRSGRCTGRRAHAQHRGPQADAPQPPGRAAR